MESLFYYYFEYLESYKKWLKAKVYRAYFIDLLFAVSNFLPFILHYYLGMKNFVYAYYVMAFFAVSLLPFAWVTLKISERNFIAWLKGELV